MAELVTLSFEGGHCGSGFAAVTAQLWESAAHHPIKCTGSLPGAVELIEYYRSWKLLYSAFYQRLDWPTRIKIDEADVTNVSVVEFHQVCQKLSQALNSWLNAESFRAIDRQIRTQLNPAEATRIVIETDDPVLARLPWHQWQLLEDFPKAEVALSTASYVRSQKAPVLAPARIKILAVLGCSAGIDLEQDRQSLESLAPQAELTLLVEPTLEILHQQLWAGCQILFFGGHSSSQDQGVLYLSPTCSLTIDQLKHALRKAIHQGLQLAIFNSCDGLALAQALAELHIPQVIVMREPVPDRVAQAFLKQFLSAFTAGKSLYGAVREGREVLQGLEERYPCASWLPMICQNPAETPCSWQSLGGAAPQGVSLPEINLQRQQEKPQRLRPKIVPVLSTSLVMTLGIMALRLLGWLQPWELGAFDHMMRLRPPEGPDPRLLVIAVTEADFQLPEQAQRQGSLSEQALLTLLERLLPLQPRAIGLDIYRDFPAQAGPSKLGDVLANRDRIFAICKVSDATTDHPGVAPPPEVPLDRQGFSDVVKDADTVLRRHLLALNPASDSPCLTPYSLSAQLVFRYLQDEGVTAQYTAAGDLQLGQVRVRRLWPRLGPYTNADLWGYQSLLNYRALRSPLEVAPIVSLKTALKGQLRPEDVQDRIVLIGVTAESAGDFIATPYYSEMGNRQTIPGVILQAQMVSQLLSAVEDDRPLLTVWPLWAELGWIGVWALAGSTLAISLKSPYRLILASGAALGLLGSACFALFWQGQWVPLVPSAVVLVLSSGTIAVIQTHRQPQDL